MGARLRYSRRARGEFDHGWVDDPQRRPLLSTRVLYLDGDIDEEVVVGIFAAEVSVKEIIAAISSNTELADWVIDPDGALVIR